MPKNNSTANTKEVANERIRMSVRQRLQPQQPQTISIKVSQEFIDLCALHKSTPEIFLKGFIKDVVGPVGYSPDDPAYVYDNFYHHLAQKYISTAYDRITRIIKGGEYIDRPKRTFN